MNKIGVVEWVIYAVQAFNENAKSKVRLNGKFIEDFSIKDGVHQAAVLNLLLFFIVTEV